MLPLVKTSPKKLENYKELISEELFQEIEELAKDLKGLKIFQVNATPRGGGVAEILKSLVPLMKGVGLKAEWYTIPGKKDFFEITKEIHNALQGKEYLFPFSHRVKYLQHLQNTAKLMKEMKPDIWVIHDPQPAGLILYLPHLDRAICRIHIDLTSPNARAWKFFAGIFSMYDKIILSSKAFIKKEIKEKVEVFPPAIDPLVSKNQPLKLEFSKKILKIFGINPNWPLISQVSRFDPWKGILELIDAYQIAKKKIPNLQLSLVGFSLAQDDPEARKIYQIVKKRAEKDPNIFLFFNPQILGNLKVNVFVNAIQVASNVIIQNSTREGFGLSLAEAMWKQKAVIGGQAAGIKLQIQNKKNGFLASNPKELSKRIIQLIENQKLAEKLAKSARETVKEKFLLPRLLRDYLKVFKELIK